MILKGNMLKLTRPFFWAVQSIWLLSFKSIETFIAAIILLLISFLGIVIKSNTYNITVSYTHLTLPTILRV